MVNTSNTLLYSIYFTTRKCTVSLVWHLGYFDNLKWTPSKLHQIFIHLSFSRNWYCPTWYENFTGRYTYIANNKKWLKYCTQVQYIPSESESRWEWGPEKCVGSQRKGKEEEEAGRVNGNEGESEGCSVSRGERMSGGSVWVRDSARVEDRVSVKRLRLSKKQMEKTNLMEGKGRNK